MNVKNVKMMAQNLRLATSYYGVCGGGTPTKNCREFCCWNKSGNKDEDDLIYAEYIGTFVVHLDIGGITMIGKD